MSNTVQIQPKEITLNIKSIRVEVPYLLLNVMAMVRVQCFDENNNLLITHNFELVGDDYQLWKDDTDLIDYVCDKYGFDLA
jgi:hypothetical protein